MSGNKAVLDSNVIVFFSKRKIDIDSLYLKYDEFFVSIVTFIEVYAYEFENNAEKEIIDSFLENVEIVDVDREIADQTIIYRKAKAKRIQLPDAVILSTAKTLGAELITDNISDFQGIDSSVAIIGISNLIT
ncbi:MAG: type II toxin-antitoxin system VapC family toxin [Pyrinomonadaceae bacterium]